MHTKLLALGLLALAFGCAAPDKVGTDPANADKTVEPVRSETAPPTQDFEGKVRPLLVANCSPCHVGSGAKKGVNVEFVSVDDKEVLREMHDEVESGTMPPKTAKQLDEATKAALLAALAEAAK